MGVGALFRVGLALVTAGSCLGSPLSANADIVARSSVRSSAQLTTSLCDSQFHLVAAPAGSAAVNSMAVVAPNDIWAVGTPSPGASTLQGTVEHWDGASWSLAAPPFQGALRGATAVAGDPLCVDRRLRLRCNGRALEWHQLERR
jgi:hypothetical protein